MRDVLEDVMAAALRAETAHHGAEAIAAAVNECLRLTADASKELREFCDATGRPTFEACARFEKRLVAYHLVLAKRIAEAERSAAPLVAATNATVH